MPRELPHLKEALGGLQLPRHALRQWLGDVQAFCREHGGKKHYAELMELIEACQAQLAQDGIEEDGDEA